LNWLPDNAGIDALVPLADTPLLGPLTGVGF
jgi:hypothetical protein